MPAEEPVLGADANSPMPQDSVMGGDGTAPTDPTMGNDAATTDPALGNEPTDEPMSDDTMSDNGEDNGELDDEVGAGDGDENSITKEIDDLKSTLNADHLEAWAKYGRSMADEEQGEEMGAEEENEPNPLENPITPQTNETPEPMMERVIFTKGQLRKLNETRLKRK